MFDDINKIKWPGWETTRLIGRGSFGAVYEIKRTVLGGEEEYAAMKIISIPQKDSDIDELRSEGCDDASIKTIFSDHLESIVKEYSTMKRMSGSHNVVECDDVRYFPHDNGFGWDVFIKMELLTPLSKLQIDTVDEETIINIAIDICSALELCKRNNIIHRDIKPHNIFLSKYGDYKLGDFGIAKTIEKTTGGTKTGTPDFMAPEVYNNQPYGYKADMYSLGVVLYWLLNNRRAPFLPQPPETPLMSVREEARQRRFNGEEIPEPINGSGELKKIVMKACAFNENDRFSDISEMKNALKLLLNGTDSPPPPAPPSPPTPTPPSPKVPVLWIIGIAVIVIAIVGAIVVFATTNNKTDVDVPTDGVSISDENDEIELNTEETTNKESNTEETTAEEQTTEDETTTEEATTAEKEPTEAVEVTTTQKETTEKKDEPKYTIRNETVYAKETVNIRREASSNSKKIGSLKKGDDIYRIAIGDNGWSKVDYKGKTAYIASEYLSTTEPTTKPTTTKPTTTESTTTKKEPTTKPTAAKPSNTAMRLVVVDTPMFDDDNGLVIIKVNPNSWESDITTKGGYVFAKVRINGGYEHSAKCYITADKVNGCQEIIIETSKIAISSGSIISFTIPAGSFVSMSGKQYNYAYTGSVTY